MYIRPLLFFFSMKEYDLEANYCNVIIVASPIRLLNRIIIIKQTFYMHSLTDIQNGFFHPQN